MQQVSQIRLYAAGKISKSGCGEVLAADWRNSVLKVCPVIDGTPGEGWREPVPVPDLPGAVYVGPHVDPVEHVCEGDCRRAHGSRSTRAGIAAGCLRSVTEATHIFAWIDTVDVYGTVMEIGYARALGKQVYVYQSDLPELKELWLASQIASAHRIVGTVEEAWHDFMLRVGIPQLTTA